MRRYSLEYLLLKSAEALNDSAEAMKQLCGMFKDRGGDPRYLRTFEALVGANERAARLIVDAIELERQRDERNKDIYRKTGASPIGASCSALASAGEVAAKLEEPIK